MALCWVLPLAEELLDSPGNLTLIARFFGNGQHPQPFIDGFKIWAVMISGVLLPRLVPPTGNPIAPDPSAVAIILAVLQMVGLLVADCRRAPQPTAVRRAVRRRRASERRRRALVSVEHPRHHRGLPRLLDLDHRRAELGSAGSSGAQSLLSADSLPELRSVSQRLPIRRSCSCS